LKTVLITLLICTSLLSKSDNPIFTSDLEAGKWISFYYQNKEPQKLASAFNYLCDKGWMNSRKTAASMFGFFQVL
jgi:hypothetical protein